MLQVVWLRRKLGRAGADLPNEAESKTSSVVIRPSKEGVRQASIAEIRDWLGEPVQMAPLQKEMSVWQALQALHKQMGVKGQEVAFLVDTPTFWIKDQKGQACSTTVKFPPFPKRMALSSALRLTLGQLPLNDSGATFRIRRGYIENHHGRRNETDFPRCEC